MEIHHRMVHHPLTMEEATIQPHHMEEATIQLHLRHRHLLTVETHHTNPSHPQPPQRHQTLLQDITNLLHLLVVIVLLLLLAHRMIQAPRQFPHLHSHPFLAHARKSIFLNRLKLEYTLSAPTKLHNIYMLMFICSYWSNHPTLIWGVLGWWGTLGHAFGVTSAPGFSPNMSLQQALSNNLSDGYGALYREGTASWLNSLVNHRFPFTTDQVRQSFVSAIHSEKTAAAQAQLFKSANEGRFRPRG